MRKSTFLFLLSCVVLGSCDVPAELYSPLIPRKVLTTFKTIPDPVKYPQYTTTNGIWRYFSPDTWTSGFFPATPYALNARKAACPATDENQLDIADWVDLGRSASTGLISLEAGNGQGHDQGFLSFPFVEELAINPDNITAQTAVKAFAQILANRFNPIVGCTRSWDKAADPKVFQVIIDNMMNLELLFHAAELTGNDTLRDIAVAHADTTMKHHIREDGSTWHVIEYNTTTGDVIRKRTGQGYSDDSTWSRGQAWGIYGFSNMYTLTQKVDYLETARRLAEYFLDNLPSDEIVPWDFNAPLEPAPRAADSSAATIASMGLLLLSEIETIDSKAAYYRDSAINVGAFLDRLNGQANQYSSPRKITAAITRLAWNESWQSLLANGTVHMPMNNSLTGTVYGKGQFTV
ncbi:hypothetical protein H0H87_004978 [Tephrocybe sp. NHM501043]|nr:hypothetical protein H0H87_004978 [Tephrocybe sp. NHM501043]